MALLSCFYFGGFNTFFMPSPLHRVSPFLIQRCGGWGGDARAHVHRHTKQNLQPSDGVMIVVPSACLTKTLTQQLVVYSFALDNRMCSSIRPQIIQCVKIRSCVCVCVCVSFLHTHICAGYVNMSQFTGRRDGGVRGTRAEKGGGHVKEKAGHRGGERDGNGQRSIYR